MGTPIQVNNDYETTFDKQLKEAGLNNVTGEDNKLPEFDRSETGNQFSGVDIKPYQEVIPNLSLPFKDDQSNKNFLDKTYRQIKAENQNTSTQIFNAVAGGLGAGILGGLENIALIPQSFSDDFEKNSVAQIFADMKQFVNESTPIYTHSDVKGLSDIDEAADIWQGLKSVVDSAVSFGIPGGAIVKGVGYASKLNRVMRLSKLGKVLNANKIGSKVYDKTSAFMSKVMNSKTFQEMAKSGVAGVVSNQLEGTVMAIELYDSVLKDLQSQGIDEKKAREIAQERANEMEEMNRSMLLSNVFQLHGLGKAMAGTRNIMTAPGMMNAMKNSLSLKTPSNNIILQNLMEGAEEMYQSSIQQSLEHLAKSDAGLIEESKDKYALMRDYLFTDQSLYEGMLGFFGGALQRGTSALIQGKEVRTQEQKRYEAQQKSIKNTSDLMASNVKDFAKAEIIRQKAMKEGDTNLESLLGDVQFLNLAATSFEMGTTGHLEGILDDMSKSKVAEDKEVGVKLKERLLDLESKYVKTIDKHSENTRNIFLKEVFNDILVEQLDKTQAKKEEVFSSYKNKVNAIAKSHRISINYLGSEKPSVPLYNNITIDENGNYELSQFVNDTPQNQEVLNSFDKKIANLKTDLKESNLELDLITKNLEENTISLEQERSPEVVQEKEEQAKRKEKIEEVKEKINSDTIFEVEKEVEQSLEGAVSFDESFQSEKEVALKERKDSIVESVKESKINSEEIQEEKITDTNLEGAVPFDSLSSDSISKKLSSNEQLSSNENKHIQDNSKEVIKKADKTIETKLKLDTIPNKELEIVESQIVDHGHNKIAYLSSQFDSKVKEGKLTREDILDENGKITLNPEYIYNLRPDKMLKGTEIILSPVENTDGIYVYDKGEKILYKDWKNKNLESNDKVPIEIIAEGQRVGFLHDLDWINESNVQGEDISISDQKEYLSKLRDRIIKEGKLKTKVSYKSNGKFLYTKENTIRENTPNSTLALYRDGVFTNKSDGTALPDINIEGDHNEGTLYNLIRLQDNNYHASRVKQNKVQNNQAESIIQAIDIFVKQEETDTSKMISEKLGYDILTIGGLSNYIKLFYEVKNTKEYPIELDTLIDDTYNFINNKDFNTSITGRPFIVIEQGNIIFGREGTKKSSIQYVTKNSKISLDRFKEQLSQGYMNVSSRGFDKSVIMIDKDGKSFEPYNDYNEYLKDNVFTNIYGIEIEKGVDIYTTQPVIQFELDVDNYVEEVNEVEKEIPNELQGFMDDNLELFDMSPVEKTLNNLDKGCTK